MTSCSEQNVNFLFPLYTKDLDSVFLVEVDCSLPWKLLVCVSFLHQGNKESSCTHVQCFQTRDAFLGIRSVLFSLKYAERTHPYFKLSAVEKGERSPQRSLVAVGHTLKLTNAD